MDSKAKQQAWPRIDRYEIIREVGRGGMGVVYHAYESMLDRSVALKILPPELSHQQDFVESLRREAVSAARLRHPHIALLYEFGYTDDTAFLVMEYVPGSSLRELLEAGSLSKERTLTILSQIADGLDYAHSQGIVHRDVKPSNILVSSNDHAMLIDFGLADMVENALITIDSAILGTPHYMAPEQAAGYGAEARSDQYALAAVAYEMLTGYPPFHGRNATAVVHAHIYEPPAPPTERRPTLPIAVNHVLLRALSKEPYERYPTVTDFVNDLRLALVAPEQVQHPVARWRRSLRWGALLTLAVVGLGLGLWQSNVLGGARPQAIVLDPSVSLPNQVVWAHETPLVGGPALVSANGTLIVGSLDGSLVGLRADTGEQRWSLRAGETVFGAPSAGADLIFVGNDDGDVLGLSPGSGGTIWRARVIGGMRHAPAFDGERLVATTDRGYVYLLQPNSGQVLWSRPLIDDLQPPVIGGGRILISSGQTLFALDVSNGVVDWKFVADSPITTTPAVIGEQVVVGTERGVLFVVDLVGGKERFRYQARGAVTAAPAVADDTFFVVDHAGNVTALRSGSATEVWRFDADAAITATPLFVDDKLFVGAGDGTLYTLDARNGRELGRIELGGSIGVAPLLDKGLVYVRGDSVYALGP